MTRNSKNKKNKERASGAFRNSPFKALKGIETKAHASPPEAHKVSPREDPEDEGDLFLRSVSGTRPLAADDGQEPETLSPMKAATRPRDDEQNSGELFLRAMGALKAPACRDDTPETDDAVPSRSFSSRMRRLKRGTLRIDEELDLHGYLKDEALRRLKQFISGAYARGAQAVLVITGKGINSPEGPVLPGAVAAWLAEQGKGMVAEFHPAPRAKGGSGAVIVFLRRREGK